MHIYIAKDGALSLRQAENMRAFSIIEETPGSAAVALESIAEAAPENHFWIEAEAVIAMSELGEDADWLAQFWAMLEKSEPYGYADLASGRVKAHVEAS